MSKNKTIDFSKPLIFRLNPHKEKDVTEHIQAQANQGFNLRQIVTDAVRRNLGISPELFHENQRSLTIGDLKGLLGETVDILEKDMDGIMSAIQDYKAELEGYAEAQKALFHDLLGQVSRGELSFEEAAESFDSEADAYALKIMKSLDDRYTE